MSAPPDRSPSPARALANHDKAMLDKLKRLFGRKDMPADARQAFVKAKDTKDLLRALEDVKFQNELELRKTERDIDTLEARFDVEAGKIREGDLSEAQKRVTLQGIKRLRDETTAKNAKITIHSKNMTLMTNLMGRIEQIEAMNLRGVEASQIDAIISSFDENFDRYQDVVLTSEAVDRNADFMSSRERAELEALEQEILGKNEEPQETETASELVERSATVAEAAQAAVDEAEVDADIDAALEEAAQAVLSDDERAELAELERQILEQARGTADDEERATVKPKARDLETE